MQRHRISVAVARPVGLLVIGLVAGLIVGGTPRPVAAATFVIVDGTAIDGRVVQATRNTVTVEVAIGGLRQLAIGQVREVRLIGADGRVIAGRLRDCAGGRCVIEAGPELVWFEGDRVVERTPVQIVAASAPARTDQIRSDQARADPTPATIMSPAARPIAAAAPPRPAPATPGPAIPAASPRGAAAPVVPAVVPALAPARPNPARPYAAGSTTAMVTMAIPPHTPSTAAALPLTELPRVAAAPVTSPSQAALATPPPSTDGTGPAALVAVVRPATAAPAPTAASGQAAPPMSGGDPAALPVVTVTTRPAGLTEASGEIVFAVELSRPLAESVVVIYSTVDAGAKAGLDYDARHGILTLPPGTTTGEIRTAVLDDAEPEGEEDFQLFLAADRAVTTIAEPWTTVTIQDDD